MEAVNTFFELYTETHILWNNYNSSVFCSIDRIDSLLDRLKTFYRGNELEGALFSTGEVKSLLSRLRYNNIDYFPVRENGGLDDNGEREAYFWKEFGGLESQDKDEFRNMGSEYVCKYGAIMSCMNAIIEEVSNVMDYRLKSEQPQEEQEQRFTLPKELNTERARLYFQKAIEAGLMMQTETGYNWNRSKALLAYFTDKIYPKSYPDNAISLLFNTTRLGKARSQLANNKHGYGKPKGYEDIDILFNEAAD